MPNSTNPGDIWVVGQRREPGGSFPSAGGGGTGDHGNGGTHSNQDEVEEPGLETPFNPCAQAGTALEWNADAAAAEAAKQMAQNAASQTPAETLNTREWAAYLYRDAAGSIQVGPISPGPPFSSGGVGSAPLVLGNFTPSQIVGAVHSHSVGNHLPSPANPQGSGDVVTLAGLVNYTGNADVRFYIVAPNTGPAGFTQYNQINVYNNQTAQAAIDANQAGPEVNPEGTPCP